MVRSGCAARGLVNPEVLLRARLAGITLAGSILAAAPPARLSTATQLVHAGAWLHADLIDATYPLGRGVDVETVNELTTVYADCLDVHVLGSVALLEGLRGRPGRVTVHAPTPAAARALLTGAAGMASQLWLSIEVTRWSAQTLADVLVRQPVDGILIMLTPPGDPRHQADLSATKSDVWRLAQSRGALGVDGGVRAADIPLLASLGASYIVVGRALLDDNLNSHRGAS